MEIRDQIEWEKAMINFGVSRFRNAEQKAKDNKRYTQTNAGGRLLKGYLSQVSEMIAHHCAGNRAAGRYRTKYTATLKMVEPDKIAMFVLTEIVNAVYESTAVATVSRRIGRMIEDELKFGEFSIAMPELFDQMIRSLDQRNSTNYRHRHRVLTHSMNKHAVHWDDWSEEQAIGVGALALSLALDSTDLVYKETERHGRKQINVLKATPDVHEWVRQSDDAVAVMLPDRMPCTIPPDDWTSPVDGGYYYPRLRMTTPLVKTRTGFAGNAHKKLLATAQMPEVLSAVNAMQRTAWAINEPVLNVMQEIWDKSLGTGMPPSQPYVPPPSPVQDKKDLTAAEKEILEEWKNEAREVYELEKKRKSNVLGAARTMRIGSMLLKHPELYYVYQLDFRARTYSASAGVSPQGDDLSKAVLRFAKGCRLTTRGAYWLKVHGANKYGEDKCSYDERVAWVDERREQWLAVAADPIGNRGIWGAADKPYQFLAWCFEYRGYVEHGPDFISHLPVALDGSCNGLQHFSAMLRDSIGGRAVNLTAGDKPSDIYQDVADVCTEKLKELRTENTTEGLAARNWLDLFTHLGHDKMPRKLSKKPVMTLPYGSTQQACTSSIFSWYIEQETDFFPKNTNFRHAVFLSRLMWESIGEVVIAARAAMSWIQTCASMISKTGNPIQYTSPLGFPVYQGSRKADSIRISTRVGGSQMRIRLLKERDEIDSRKQRQGSSPNLVHDTDATHMHMCINAGVKVGIDSFAMIHDDFGVHACHVEEWHKIIREQFYKLHTEHNVLKLWKERHEADCDIELPDLPATGDLDLRAVLDSPYFFG